MLLGSGAMQPPQITSYSSDYAFEAPDWYSSYFSGSISVGVSGNGLSFQWYRSNYGNYSPSTCGDSYQVALTDGGTNSRSGTQTNTLSFGHISPGYEYSTWGTDTTTGWYKLVVSNAAGSVSTPWMRVFTRIGRYSCGQVGYNCSPCSYDCNCDCYWQDNCCCYDSNGDGITCCDVNGGDVSACCRADQCGQSYNCYNCSTCWDYCSWGCSDNPCSHSCAWYDYTYCWNQESYAYFC